MAMIQGRNGRTYQDGKRVENPVNHPETRDPATVRRAAMSRQPKQPSGIPDVPVNPFAKTAEMEKARHNNLWPGTVDGRRVLSELKRKSDEWQADQQVKADAAEFAASVEPMVQHAQKTLAQAEADASVTVAELEQLRSNVQLARSGDHDGYKAADAAWRTSQREKREQAAHAHDDQIRTLAGERDSILAEAWRDENDSKPVPEVKAIEQPEPDQRVTGAEAERLNRQLAETRQRIANGELRRGGPPTR